MLRDDLKVVLEIQELDVQMIHLMRLKREREQEQNRIHALRNDLSNQVVRKENDILELKKQVRLLEVEGTELKDKIRKLESQQNNVKKVEEFNALTHEISSLEREKAAKEQRLSDLYDKQAHEEEMLTNLKATFESTKKNSKQMQVEIADSITAINTEGTQFKAKRDELVQYANNEILRVYEKLLNNKRDRVIVPIENRCCSGCHILVTAQHENIVRKGEKLVFCEHCSRIHYWQDALQAELQEDTQNQKRKKRARSATIG